MKQTAIIVFVLLPLAKLALAEPLPIPAFRLPDDCSQAVVVTSSGWENSAGKLQRFERDYRSAWRAWGRPTDVQLGRRGMAWGRGLTKTEDLSGPHKREGDDKAPAGLFQFGVAFGYAKQPPETRLRYEPITGATLCVDDPESQYYNRIVHEPVKQRDWRSAEKMKLRDIRYKWGVFVLCNTPPQRGAGSCIFLHVWKDAYTATSGCTAMPEPMMLSLIKWLDPASHPVLVQVPREFFVSFAVSNGIPLSVDPR